MKFSFSIKTGPKGRMVRDAAEKFKQHCPDHMAKFDKDRATTRARLIKTDLLPLSSRVRFHYETWVAPFEGRS